MQTDVDEQPRAYGPQGAWVQRPVPAPLAAPSTRPRPRPRPGPASAGSCGRAILGRRTPPSPRRSRLPIARTKPRPTPRPRAQSSCVRATSEHPRPGRPARPPSSQRLATAAGSTRQRTAQAAPGRATNRQLRRRDEIRHDGHPARGPSDCRTPPPGHQVVGSGISRRFSYLVLVDGLARSAAHPQEGRQGCKQSQSPCTSGVEDGD